MKIQFAGLPVFVIVDGRNEEVARHEKESRAWAAALVADGWEHELSTLWNHVDVNAPNEEAIRYLQNNFDWRAVKCRLEPVEEIK